MLCVGHFCFLYGYVDKFIGPAKKMASLNHMIKIILFFCVQS
jgi:hypothetical protein